MKMNFRTKPQVIEAIQWTGDNYSKLLEWSIHLPEGFTTQHSAVRMASPLIWENNPSYTRNSLEVATPNGVTLCHLNDWIVKDVNGNFYPFKPNDFDKYYEHDDNKDGLGYDNEDLTFY